MSSSIAFHGISATEEDAFRLTQQPRTSNVLSFGRSLSPIASARVVLAGAAAVVALLTLILSGTALSMARQASTQADLAYAAAMHEGGTPMQPASKPVPIQRIAFGSCTSHDLRPQPIWQQVVSAKVSLP
jgi:hypothetical protein